MKMAQIAVPSGSAINDIVLILESIKDVSKTKTLLKNLQEIVTEYNELSAKNSIDLHEIHKAKESIGLEVSKNEAFKSELVLAKESLELEKLEQAKLSLELEHKKTELSNKETSLNVLKTSLMEEFLAKEKDLEVEKYQASENLKQAQALIEEYNDKLSKLKAVML